jgi:threonine aldolase
MVHAKGFSAILGNKSHINVYEQGGISTIGGIFPRIVNNLSDGSMEIKDILDQIPDPNIHYCPVSIFFIIKILSKTNFYFYSEINNFRSEVNKICL